MHQITNAFPLATLVLLGCSGTPAEPALADDDACGHYCHYDPAKEDGPPDHAHSRTHDHSDLDGDGNCGGGNNPDGDPDNPGKAHKL